MGAAQGKIIEIGNHKLTVQSQLKSPEKHKTLFITKDANGRLFLLKRIVISKHSKGLFARAKWEADLYQQLPAQKNLLQCYGLKRFVDKDGNSQHLFIMEFCSGGSLKKTITRRRSSFAVPDVMQVLLNVCGALMVLHTHDPQIAHFGVRVDNIFRSCSGDWVLGDFGNSAVSPINFSGLNDARKFDLLIEIPKQYQAPELINIRNVGQVDISADIWALGVVFYFLLFTKYPFESGKAAILLGEYDVPTSPAYEKPVIDLLESMLQVDCSRRPSVQELYREVNELYEHYWYLSENNSPKTSLRPSLIPADPGLTHYWGHNWQKEICFKQHNLSYSAELSSTMNQALHRVIGDVLHWTTKAIAGQMVPPKAKYIRLLVILAWERQDCPSSEVLPGMFECLFKQPVFTIGISAYKSLQLIHKLMQECPDSFLFEILQHRSFLLTIAERWQSQQYDIDPWLSQALVTYALVLEQRVLFIRNSFLFESNFSICSYLVHARKDRYAGFRPDIWVPRCLDVTHRMLELGLQFIVCGFLSMGVSGIGPSRQHLFFRETILVPILDDLSGIFSAATFLLGITMECGCLHRTDIRDTHCLYQTFFSRFQALMLRASKSALVATLQRLPELPRVLPELSMDTWLYPPASNIPGQTSHNVEYCEELRSQFVQELKILAKTDETYAKSKPASRSATAPTIHKNVSCKFNLQNVFGELHFGDSAKVSHLGAYAIPTSAQTCVSSPTSPVPTMKRRLFVPNASSINPRPRTPMFDHTESSEFGCGYSNSIEWTPSTKSFDQRTAKIQVHSADHSSTRDDGNFSPFDSKPSAANIMPQLDLHASHPELAITVTKDDDVENPFAVIERSFKAQNSQPFSSDSKSLFIDTQSASIYESDISADDNEIDKMAPSLGSGEISVDEIQFGPRIGVGGFAEVFKGEWRGTDVAIKRLLVQKRSTSTLREFRKEVALLRSLRHPYIVMFMGACTVPPNLLMVTELLQMSLFDLLHNTNVKLSWKLRLKIALDTAMGINFLHHSGVIHRDLKSANLLLDKHYGVKVSDFGLSRVKAQHVTMTGQCGTFQWMAPEVISNEKYTEKADIYSFGIILWELAVRKIPFEGMNGVQVSVAVATQNLRPSIPDDVPVDIRALIESCWRPEPALRPAFPGIVQSLRNLHETDLNDA